MVPRAFFGLLCALLALPGCDAPAERPPAPPAAEAATTRDGVREGGEPLRQGFTQRPSPGTPGLPPRIPPWLGDESAVRARELWQAIGESKRAAAQQEVEGLVTEWESDPAGERLDRLRGRAHELSREGRLAHRTIAELYAEYLFPNDVAEADRRYKGRWIVLTGTVAPHNMKDFADGFKLVETRPYVHEPLLLATDYELSFVECRLSRPEAQPLRDWEPIHFVASVAGKRRSDVTLDRCVVLPSAPR